MPVLFLLSFAAFAALAAAADGQEFPAAVSPPPPVSVVQALEIEQLPPVDAGGPVFLDDPYLPGPYRGEGFAAGVPRDAFDDLWAPRPWSWHILPNNLIYTSYLAGPKEPRFATVWYDDTAPDPFTPSESAGWLWDSTLGGRVSILRYGSDPVLHPQGFEVKI